MNSLDPWRTIALDSHDEVVWPRPRYEHPFYREIPSWIHYGQGNGTSRTLFDGVFIAGAADMSTTNQRTGLTAEVAPIIAPASGGITFKNELDGKGVLHVEVSVDGKRYQTSMNLAPAIAMVMDKLSRWHADQHAPTVVGGGIEAAVGEATDGMVALLVGRHVECVCGSFLDDIGNAVKGAASGIAGGVSSTFKALKGPIATAAAAAAASGAAMIPGVGPFVAPMAGKFANDLVNSTLGDSAAQKRVAEAKKQAQTNPDVALALDEAKKAVAHSTVAHHVQRKARHAAQGHPEAKQQIAQVIADAQGGDPAAKAVMDIISNALGGGGGDGGGGGGDGLGAAASRAQAVASGWVDVVGTAVDDLRERARGYATKKAGNAAGVIQTADRSFHSRGFPSLDDAIDWLQRSTGRREDFIYAAAYEKGSDGEAYIQAEEFGGSRAPTPGGAMFHRDVPATSGMWR